MAAAASEKVWTYRWENDALCFVSITLMVTHFASHKLGRLEDDKLTMTPLGHCCMRSPLDWGCGFQHSMYQGVGTCYPIPCPHL